MNHWFNIAVLPRFTLYVPSRQNPRRLFSAMSPSKMQIRVQYYNPELLFLALIFSVITGISASIDYPYKKTLTLIFSSITAITFIYHLLFDPKNGLLDKLKNRDKN